MVIPDLKKATGEVNLIAQGNGAQAIACSDMYFSEMHNLLKEVPAVNMGDGWETKRSRPPGDDWVIIKLGDLGVPTALEVDTAFFKEISLNLARWIQFCIPMQSPGRLPHRSSMDRGHCRPAAWSRPSTSY